MANLPKALKIGLWGNVCIMRWHSWDLAGLHVHPSVSLDHPGNSKEVDNTGSQGSDLSDTKSFLTFSCQHIHMKANIGIKQMMKTPLNPRFGGGGI